MDRKENERPRQAEAARPTLNRFKKPLPIPMQESPFTLNTDDANFSRKREPTSPLRAVSGNRLASNQPKRHKKTNSKAQKNEQLASALHHAESSSHLRAVSDGRPSRFREETMRDHPSQKPPSMFLRILPGASRINPSVDHLMEGYHEERNGPPPQMQASRSASRATQMSGLTHHQNASISSNATLSTSNQSRDSGIARFGRTFVSSMNPLSLWHKVTKTRESKEMLPQYDDDELAMRQLKAEQAYATLKREGKLGTLGSRARSVDFKTLAAGYTSPDRDLSYQRDSGIDMTVDIRSSDEIASRHSAQGAGVQRTSAIPGTRSPSKKFHLRTPSFQDLKRIASDINLHRRTTSESTSADLTPTPHFVSPESESCPITSAAPAPAKSKKEVVRQAKLTKKASDLEAKLVSVQRELNQIRTKELLASYETPEYRPKSAALLRKRFEPLPALPSESLLLAEEASRTKTSAAAFDKLPDLPLSPAKEHNATVEVTGIATEQVLPVAPPTAESKSVFESSSVETSPTGPIRRALKKHKKLIRSSSKPDINAESKQGKSSPKKEGSPKKDSPRRLRPKANPGSPKRLRGSISSPILPPVEASEEDQSKDVRSSLDTVQEESYVAMSFKVALNSPPAFPTAFATPANPRGNPHRHTRSLSPVKNTPASMLGPENDHGSQHQRASYASPGPNINFSRPTSPRKEPASPARPTAAALRPTAGSPEVPRLAPAREDWEWPEDIF